MLTVEMLRQNAALKDLPDNVLGAIAEMSRNDENTVIGTRIGALHGQYDRDIFDVTGIAKRDGEKSYDYAKRVLGDYKVKASSVDTIKSELETAKNQVADLQAKLEKGAGNEELTQQLKDARTQVTQLQAQLKTKETEFATKKTEYEKSVKDIHVNYAFQAATAGLKFKAGITEPIQKTLLGAAKAEILSKGTPDFVDDGKGGKVLVLRGKDGNILNNPANNLNPYTIQELVMETSLKDVIDNGRQGTGGGTGGNGGNGGGGGNLLDLSGVKNQVEADKVIETYLLGQGLTRDSAEFAAKSLEIRDENKVSELPIR